jgi:hypothetical protein
VCAAVTRTALASAVSRLAIARLAAHLWHTRVLAMARSWNMIDTAGSTKLLNVAKRRAEMFGPSAPPISIKLSHNNPLRDFRRAITRRRTLTGSDGRPDFSVTPFPTLFRTFPVH